MALTACRNEVAPFTPMGDLNERQQSKFSHNLAMVSPSDWSALHRCASHAVRVTANAGYHCLELRLNLL